MKIYKKIILMFLASIILLTLALSFNQTYEVKQMQILGREELINKQQMINDLLILENNSIRKVIEDYSNWDEMVKFVKGVKEDWAAQNIDTLTDTINVPYIWVYDLKLIPRHFYFLFDVKQEMSHLLSREILVKAFEKDRYCHFFLPSSLGILEIQGSVITNYARDPSKQPVEGYLLVGRIWDKELIDHLSNLGSYFKVEMNLSTTPFSFDFDQKTSLLQISKPLLDPYGITVSYLGIKIPSDILKQFYRVIHQYYFIWSASIAIFLLLILVLIFIWIYPPLRLISEVLKTENTKTIQSIRKSKNEFGEIANLVFNFFQQKKLYIHEIEEKKEALADLKQSEEQFRVLAETLTCNVFIIQDLKIQYINSQFNKMFEFMTDEVLNLDFITLVHPDYKEMVLQKILAIEKDEHFSNQCEVPILSKAGDIIWLELSLGKTVYHNKSAVIATGFDITERKKIHKEIQNALQIKSNFTSMVSHELRTPLTAIKGAIDLAFNPSCGDLNQNQKTTLNIAKRNVDRLHRLINDILDFQKLETGNMIFHFEIVDVKEIILEALKTMSPLAEEKGLTVTSQIEKNLPLVKADTDRIYQVIINLLSNAIKFMVKGEIAIICYFKDHWVNISVKDSGVGIQEKDLERLFQPYSQISDNSFRKYPGTGLGLAISQQIVNHHNGKISVVSVLGKGTTFTFTLPVE